VIQINEPRRRYLLHKQELAKRVLGVLESGFWLNGEANRRFCENFATYIGVENFIGVANGTDALELSIRALSIKSGGKFDEVVMVPNAGGYAASACFAVGLRPVWCDIEENSQLISIDSAMSCLGERTLAVVATHLYGGLVDVPSLRKAMNALGWSHVAILEDCAQAHGLRGICGTAGAMGNISAFSFYPTKNLGAMGDAGGVATNDSELNDLVRRLQQYGWNTKYSITISGGRNSRLDEVQAAFLDVLLPYLGSENERRQNIHAIYSSALPNHARMVTSNLGTVAHLAVIAVTDRKVARAHFAAREICTDIHYPTLDYHQLAWCAGKGRTATDRLPMVEKGVKDILTLPCHPFMTQAEIEQVVDGLVCLPESGKFDGRNG